MPQTASLGKWCSPITSDLITSKTLRLSSPSLSSNGALFWLEGRPAEGGRQVLMCRLPGKDGAVTDVTESGLYVRTTAHEYGGGAYLVVEDGEGGDQMTVFFSNFKDQRVYRQTISAAGEVCRAEPLTPESGGDHGPELRFADFTWDARRQRLLCVMEQHSEACAAAAAAAAAAPAGAPSPAAAAGGTTGAAHEATLMQHQQANAQPCVDNMLVSIDPDTGDTCVLAKGDDFYACPSLSPDGRKLAWIQWCFPNMPWDGTELVVADVAEDGSLIGESIRVAGGSDEAVQQPVWSPDGTALYFITDKSGWWNLYCCSTARLEEGRCMEAIPVLPMTADFGWPMWVFGISTYQVLSSGHLLALYQDPQEVGISMGLITPTAATVGAQQQQGEGQLQQGQAQLQLLRTGMTNFSSPARLVVHEGGTGSGASPLSIAVVAAGAVEDARVAVLSVDSVEQLRGSCPEQWEVVRCSSSGQVDAGYLSAPQALTFPTTNGLTAHMVFYPPKNKDYTFPDGELPPLLVHSHGGPTGAAAVQLNLQIQYFTSRGFAVADVDYGGSTGYGREYRNRLRGSWGVVDVDDCCNAATYLVQQGLVDPKRLCISGGSAGGYTTLACLAFRQVFAAGASLYGVADLELLALHTHKFESRYLDLLLGPLPGACDVYHERSPICHVEGFNSPIIFFQGDEDRVVPPEQAIKMHAAIKKRGLPTALVMFQGEQHGFRKAENIRAALDGELFFYSQVLAFQGSMPEDLPPIHIDNLNI